MMKATGIYESCKFVSLEEFDRLNSEDVLDYKESFVKLLVKSLK